MWWAQEAVVSAEPHDSLTLLAEQVGVDHAHARDVAGAVSTFCRVRHGSVELDRDYLLFLFHRAMADKIPGVHTPPENWSALADNQVLLRALMHAGDPASLYEAHRRHLVWYGVADSADRGRAVHVNLAKIKTTDRDALALMWLPVFRKVADWVCAWRKSDADIGSVIVSGRLGAPDEWPGMKSMLAEALAVRESAEKLTPAAVLWAA
jgi:hypothetical protein